MKKKIFIGAGIIGLILIGVFVFQWHKTEVSKAEKRGKMKGGTDGNNSLI